MTLTFRAKLQKVKPFGFYFIRAVARFSLSPASLSVRHHSTWIGVHDHRFLRLGTDVGVHHSPLLEMNIVTVRPGDTLRLEDSRGEGLVAHHLEQHTWSVDTEVEDALPHLASSVGERTSIDCELACTDYVTEEIDNANVPSET